MGWLLAVVLIAACDRATQPPGEVDIGSPAPAPRVEPTASPGSPHVALPDVVLADATGARAPLRTRMRDVTVLAFWASWCGPCQLELPQLEQFAAGERDPRVAVIAVNIDAAEDRGAALAVIASKHLTMPVLFDPDDTAYAAAIGDDTEIPAIAVVGKRGIDPEIGFQQGRTAEEFAAQLRARIGAQLR